MTTPETPQEKPAGSITTWMRLEPRVRSRDMVRGVQARIHDPLWLLGRQWQLGEFKGDDTGSPVIATTQMQAAVLNRYRPGLRDAESVAYHPDTPLETLVEREPVRAPDRRNGQMEAEAGQHFLRLLARAGGNQHRQVFLERYPLQAPDGVTDGESLRFFALMAGRVPNGVTLYRDIKNGAPLPADDETVQQAAARFVQWYETLFSEADTNESWNRSRMEYQFAVAAPGPEHEIVLEGTGYSGGRLDWYSVDVAPGAAIGAGVAEPQEPAPLAAIPTPVSFRGAPGSRWWEFEDGRLDFNQVGAGRADLARLLAIPLVAAYSNEWYLIPVKLPLGAVCRVSSLVVRDTFGKEIEVSTTLAPDDSWSMYRLWSSQGLSDCFFLAPALVRSLDGPAVEEVLFLRDEMANMAWAVERTVESAAGRPMSRFEEYQAQRQRRAEVDGTRPAGAGELEYRLGTPVPDYWVPLVPQRMEEGPAIRLVRGRLVGALDGQLEPEPLGRILDPGKPLALHEEEVPREGARVTQAFQLARTADGHTHLWLGRRKGLGRGEGSSGLRFDVVDLAK